MHDAPQRCLSRPTPAKTPDSLVALAWNWFTLWMGIDLLLTLRPLNLRGGDDRGETPCRPKDLKKPAVESLPAAFCENFEHCGISAIIAARREDPAAYRRACVALLMLLADARTNRVRNKFWRAPRAISVGHQQVRRPQALATRISYYYAGWMEKGGRPGRFSARPYNATRLSHSISRGPRPVVLYPVRNAAFFYCVPALLRGGIFGAGNCQAPAARRRPCAHRCHSELAILRLARLR